VVEEPLTEILTQLQQGGQEGVLGLVQHLVILVQQAILRLRLLVKAIEVVILREPVAITEQVVVAVQDHKALMLLDL